MKIKASDIIFASNVLARRGGIEASGAARLKIARISRAVRQEGELITEALGACARHHATKDATGKPKLIQTAAGPDYPIEDQDAYREEVKRILAAEVEIAVELLAEGDLPEKGFTDITDALLPFMG